MSIAFNSGLQVAWRAPPSRRRRRAARPRGADRVPADRARAAGGGTIMTAILTATGEANWLQGLQLSRSTWSPRSPSGTSRALSSSAARAGGGCAPPSAGASEEPGRRPAQRVRDVEGSPSRADLHRDRRGAALEGLERIGQRLRRRRGLAPVASARYSRWRETASCRSIAAIGARSSSRSRRRRRAGCRGCQPPPKSIRTAGCWRCRRSRRIIARDD